MAEWTRDTPWRQGHLLTTDAAVALGLCFPDSPDDTWVMVITHDCDLATDVQSEPSIEVIIGCRIDTIDGNLANAKSLRTLDLQFNGHPPLYCRFLSTGKQLVQKATLADFEPLSTHQLTPNNKNTLQSWLASRYRRSSFPNGFIKRMSDAKLEKKISNLAKPHKDTILEVLFDLDKGDDIERTEPEDLYTLGITILYSLRGNGDEAERAATKLAGDIHTAFKAKFYDDKESKWNLVEVEWCEVISEAEMSYFSFSNHKPWRLEFVSLATDPQALIAKKGSN